MDGSWIVRFMVMACLMIGVVGAWGVAPARGACGCAHGERYEYSRLVMGTKARVVLYAPDEAKACAAAGAAFDEVARLEAIMSDYRADSALNRINQGAGEGPMKAPAELIEVLRAAESVADLTDGAFDPTMGRATVAWRRARETGRLPDEDERSRFPRQGSMQMLVEREAGTVELLDKDLRLDLGGIGKGFAAERAAAVLKARGVPRCLVSIAGDVVAGDPPPGEEAWIVGIDFRWANGSGEGDGNDGASRTVRLLNQAVSTSGDAEQHVVIEGERYSHIIDPATGLGLTRPRAACVVSSDGATADALATALCVLGPERARPVMARFDREYAVVVGAPSWDELASPERYESEGFPWGGREKRNSGGARGEAGQAGKGDNMARQEDDRRLDWFRDARFGMFIHWGLYSVLAGEWEGKPALGTAEWMQDHYDIAPDIYEKTAARFNPVKFDARAWAALAREAGMKYIVITTKHHEGFSLFDSEHSDYDVMDATPFKRDIMRELAEATRAEGLRIGWYHSIMDWHDPNANPFPFADPAMAGHKPDWNSYGPVLRAQVRELLTKYGPIAVMWFDGEWVKEWTDEQGWEMYRMCRELQPDTLVNNRVGKGRDGMAGLTKDGDHAGDFGTPEQEVPGTGLPGVDWESCMTMNDTWGYSAKDTNWKSATTLIRTLIDTASKGGNFLLNVGPTGEGEIPAESIERLREMGRWLGVNGEAIYGTHAGPFKRLAWGRCTSRSGPGGHVLYAHVFERPDVGEAGAWPRLRLAGLKTGVRRARAMGDPTGRTLEHARLPGDEGVEVMVDGVAWDPHATVIAIELDGPVEVVDLPTMLKPEADGSYVLGATEAFTRGSPRLEVRDRVQSIGFWTRVDDEVWWEFRGVPPGRYRVAIDMAVDKEYGGGEVSIDAGGEALVVGVSPLGTWGEFAEIDVGEIGIPDAGGGRSRLALRAARIENVGLMNLRSLRLLPVE